MRNFRGEADLFRGWRRARVKIGVMPEVPAGHYRGALTQRSLIHFSIGHHPMPKEVYHAYGYVENAARRPFGRSRPPASLFFAPSL
jgi:hypothetical protein